MAVSLFANEVSDLCLGKPPLRSLSVSATVADALLAFKTFGEFYLSVWSCDLYCDNQKNNSPRTNPGDVIHECRCVGKICLADVICFLCKDENLKNPGVSLQKQVSVLIPKQPALVRHLEPNASLFEATDLIQDGAQNLVIPTHSPFSRKKLNKLTSNFTLHNHHEYCWLTQEDIIRYLLNSIGLFSPIPNHTIESLGIIESTSILAVHYDAPASSLLPLISESLVKESAVAILDAEGRLVGEISPAVLNSCEATVAAAIATLSAGDLMAYIDCGDPPEDLIQLVKERLEEGNLMAVMEWMEEETGLLSSSSLSSYSSFSSSSSLDEDFGLGKSGRLGCNTGKVVRNTDAIVCYPWSSLVAVMIQALSHRVSYVWVVEVDGTLTGVVTFAGMLKVFREHLRSRP